LATAGNPERPVNDIVGRLELSQPGVSKHLTVLRDAGLVEVRQDAQRRLYWTKHSEVYEASMRPIS
jgi:DNA-binding transcriptional ArsR family regulator